MTDELFGELRSLCHDPARPFDEVCRLLERWPEEAAREIAVPYTVEHVCEWEGRAAPLRWCFDVIRGRDPARFETCDALDMMVAYQSGVEGTRERVEAWLAQTRHLTNVTAYRGPFDPATAHAAMPSLRSASILETGDPEEFFEPWLRGGGRLASLCWLGRALPERVVRALDERAPGGALDHLELHLMGSQQRAGVQWLEGRIASLEAFDIKAFVRDGFLFDWAPALDAGMPRMRRLNVDVEATRHFAPSARSLPALEELEVAGLGAAAIPGFESILPGLRRLRGIRGSEADEPIPSLAALGQEGRLEELGWPLPMRGEGAAELLGSKTFHSIETFVTSTPITPEHLLVLARNPHAAKLRRLAFPLRFEGASSRILWAHAQRALLSHCALHGLALGAHDVQPILTSSESAPVLRELASASSLRELWPPSMILDGALPLPERLEVLSLAGSVLPDDVSMARVLERAPSTLRVLELPTYSAGRTLVGELLAALPSLEIVTTGSPYEDVEHVGSSACVMRDVPSHRRCQELGWATGHSVRVSRARPFANP